MGGKDRLHALYADGRLVKLEGPKKWQTVATGIKSFVVDEYGRAVTLDEKGEMSVAGLVSAFCATSAYSVRLTGRLHSRTRMAALTGRRSNEQSLSASSRRKRPTKPRLPGCPKAYIAAPLTQRLLKKNRPQGRGL